MYGSAGTGGLGGFFSELFGTAKKKDKRRAKKRRETRALQAVREKAERADQRRIRRAAQIRDSFRAVNAEALNANTWIQRIQRMLTETPGLPARLVNEAVAGIRTFESTVSVVSTGIGELDLGAVDPRVQDAVLAELQAALAAIRTVRAQASRLKQKVDASVAASQAKSARLASLIKQQTALNVREKLAQRRLAGGRETQTRYAVQQQRITSLRTQAQAGSLMQSESAALAIAMQQLRGEERRAAMMAAFREGRSVVPFMSRGAFSGLRGAW